MKRHIPILLATACSLLAPLSAAKPNVIFILADDMGIGGLSCYSEAPDYMATPHIDKLATQGTRFTKGLASYPTCKPSRCSIVTGQYGVRTGSYRVSNLSTDPEKANGNVTQTKLISPISSDVKIGKTNLASLFKAAGYRTAMYGKWHVANEIQKSLKEYWGYDEAYVSSSVHFASHPRNKNKTLKITPPLPVWSKAKGDPYDIPQGKLENQGKRALYNAKNTKGTFLEKHSIEEHYTNMAINFIDDTLQNHPGKPFYLYLPYYLVHHPASADDKFTKEALKRIQASDKKNGTNEADDDEFVDVVAMHSMLDEFVGRIIAHLDDPNGDGNTDDSITDNTIILFTSDNGSYDFRLTGPYRGRKGDTYDGGMRVPYIFKYPKHIPSNVTKSDRISGIDIFPTLLGLAGLTPSKDQPVDGVDLSKLLTSNTPLQPRKVFCFYPKYAQYSANKKRWNFSWRNVIYDGNYKLIEYPEYNQRELFHISEDIGEKKDLSSTNIEKTRQLTKNLHAWLSSTNALRGYEPQCLIDTFVQENNIKKKGDTSPTLELSARTGARKVAYLTFDISKVPAHCKSVKLNLTSEKLTGKVEVYQVNDTKWMAKGPTGITWSTAPKLGKKLGEIDHVKAGSIFNIPLDKSIAKKGLVSLALKTTSPTNQTIHSSESPEANLRPTIILETE